MNTVKRDYITKEVNWKVIAGKLDEMAMEVHHQVRVDWIGDPISSLYGDASIQARKRDQGRESDITKERAKLLLQTENLPTHKPF